VKDVKAEKLKTKAKEEGKTVEQGVETNKIEVSSKELDKKLVVGNRVVGKKNKTVMTDVVTEAREVFKIDSFVQPIVVDSLKTTVLDSLDLVTSLVLTPDSSVAIQKDSSLLLIKSALNIDSLPEIQIPTKTLTEDSVKMKKEILKEDE